MEVPLKLMWYKTDRKKANFKYVFLNLNYLLTNEAVIRKFIRQLCRIPLHFYFPNNYIKKFKYKIIYFFQVHVLFRKIQTSSYQKPIIVHDHQFISAANIF